MPNPLFSTYDQGDNQVTGTILSVLEHLGSDLVEELLEALLDESDLAILTFTPQYRGEQGIPDAAVRGSTTLLIETKIEPRSVDVDQLNRHLETLDEESTETQRLVVLTPDGQKPTEIASISDERVAWANFDGLVSALEGLLVIEEGVSADGTRPPTERESLLIRERVRFIYDCDLTSGRDDRVLVVPARRAWKEYRNYELYFCQAERSFRPSAYLAFYRDNRIDPEVPRITGRVERIELTERGVKAAWENEGIDERQHERLQNVVSRLGEDGSERYGRVEKVLFLDEEMGFSLARPVENDKTATDSNTRVAFVRNQRYVSAAELRASPQYTSALED